MILVLALKPTGLYGRGPRVVIVAAVALMALSAPLYPLNGLQNH